MTFKEAQKVVNSLDRTHLKDPVTIKDIYDLFKLQSKLVGLGLLSTDLVTIRQLGMIERTNFEILNVMFKDTEEADKTKHDPYDRI